MSNNNVDNQKLLSQSSQKDENPIKEESNNNEVNPSESLTVKKINSNLSDIQKAKRKRVIMYSVLVGYISVSVLIQVIDYNTLNTKTKEFFARKSELFYIFLLAAAIVGSLLLSVFVSFCECLIKTHFFGILLIIILNLLNDYIIIDLTYRFNFEVMFFPLIVILSGAVGLLLMTLMLKYDFTNIYYLWVFHTVFSFVFGLIVYCFYKSFWPVTFAILAFMISMFNVYSSQYKYVTVDGLKDKRRKKKPTLIYSQPFELNISIYKLLSFLFSIFVKTIRFCIKCCSKNEKGSGNDNSA